MGLLKCPLGEALLNEEDYEIALNTKANLRLSEGRLEATVLKLDSVVYCTQHKRLEMEIVTAD